MELQVNKMPSQISKIITIKFLLIGIFVLIYRDDDNDSSSSSLYRQNPTSRYHVAV